MKEINIKIRIVNGKVGTIMTQSFDETVETIHTTIGILENLKIQQLEKLNNTSKVVSDKEDGGEI